MFHTFTTFELELIRLFPFELISIEPIFDSLPLFFVIIINTKKKLLKRKKLKFHN